jgi:hypothetical protein
MRGIRPGICGSSVLKMLVGQPTSRIFGVGPTDKGNVDTTLGKWPTLRRPTKTVLEDPSVEGVLPVLGQTEAGIRDAYDDPGSVSG